MAEHGKVTEITHQNKPVTEQEKGHSEKGLQLWRSKKGSYNTLVTKQEKVSFVTERDSNVT